MAKLFLCIDAEIPLTMTRKEVKNIISSGLDEIITWSEKYADTSWKDSESLKMYFCKFECFFLNAPIKGSIVIKEDESIVNIRISVYDSGALPEIKGLIDIIWSNDSLKKWIEMYIKNLLENSLKEKNELNSLKAEMNRLKLIIESLKTKIKPFRSNIIT